MSNELNPNEAAIDDALLEKVNPVFLTAKMTMFQLAANGDPDAVMLAEALGLTRESTQDSANTTASPEQILAGVILVESRYRTMTSLAEDSGYALVDLPCGYTPRGIAFARKGLPYYGLDLPVVIREISEQVSAALPPEGRELVHYREVDATNYASLEHAVDDIDGEVCITTEGLLMYFTDSEAGELCDNVRRILKKKGGSWYVADTESALQYFTILRALAGERFDQIKQNAKRQTMDKSDVEIGKSSLITHPVDIEDTTKRALAFLAEHGLKAERIIVADHMPELDSLSQVSPTQAQAIREGMKRCAFWKVTPDESAPSIELPPVRNRKLSHTCFDTGRHPVYGPVGAARHHHCAFPARLFRGGERRAPGAGHHDRLQPPRLHLLGGPARSQDHAQGLPERHNARQPQRDRHRDPGANRLRRPADDRLIRSMRVKEDRRNCSRGLIPDS